MNNTQIKLPGYCVSIYTNSKQTSKRVQQIVNHDTLVDGDEVKVNILTKKKIDTHDFPIIATENRITDGIDYIQNVDNFELDDIRAIIRMDNKNKDKVISMIQRNFVDNTFEAIILQRSKIALGFCMNRFEIHLAGLFIKKDYFPLHAAGIVLDGLGFCIIGQSGAGKSSTVLQLLSEGADLISNDFVCIDYNRDVYAYSIDGTIGVRRDVEYKCPYLWDYWLDLTNGKEIFSKENSEQKYYLAAELLNNRFRKFSKINYLAFVSIAPTKKIEIQKLGKMDALKLFLRNRIVVANQLRGRKNIMEVFEELYQKTVFITLKVPKWINGKEPCPISQQIIEQLRGGIK